MKWKNRGPTITISLEIPVSLAEKVDKFLEERNIKMSRNDFILICALRAIRTKTTFTEEEENKIYVNGLKKGIVYSSGVMEHIIIDGLNNGISHDFIFFMLISQAREFKKGYEDEVLDLIKEYPIDWKKILETSHE